jgi:hypothetical protein
MLTYAAFFAKEMEGESSSLSALLVTLPADYHQIEYTKPLSGSLNQRASTSSCSAVLLLPIRMITAKNDHLLLLVLSLLHVALILLQRGVLQRGSLLAAALLRDGRDFPRPNSTLRNFTSNHASNLFRLPSRTLRPHSSGSEHICLTRYPGYSSLEAQRTAGSSLSLFPEAQPHFELEQLGQRFSPASSSMPISP